MAGVKLNIDEGTMRSHLRPEIICSIPFSENNGKSQSKIYFEENYGSLSEILF